MVHHTQLLGGPCRESPGITAVVGRLDLVTWINVPELGQPENAEANRDHNLYSGQGVEEEEEEKCPFFMHELVNYGMEGMSRLCDAVVRPA